MVRVHYICDLTETAQIKSKKVINIYKIFQAKNRKSTENGEKSGIY